MYRGYRRQFFWLLWAYIRCCQQNELFLAVYTLQPVFSAHYSTLLHLSLLRFKILIGRKMLVSNPGLQCKHGHWLDCQSCWPPGSQRDVVYLDWPIVFSYMSPNAGEGGEGVVAGSQPANEYSCAHGAQINFGDLTPYLTYADQWPTYIYLHQY